MIDITRLWISYSIYLLIIVLCAASCDSPENKKGRFLLKGNEKIMENDLQGALDFYNEALKIDPQFKDAWYNRALVYQKLNRLELAVQDFTTVLQLDPFHQDAIFQRGLSYLDNGAFYNALDDGRSMSEKHPEDWRSYFLLGLVHEKLGDQNAALGAFDKALEINPDNTDLLVNKATMYFYQKEFTQSKELLLQAEKLNPEEANIYNLRSMIAFEEKDYTEAKKWIEIAIEKNDRESYYYNNRGLYLLFLGKYEDGISDINLSLKQDPNNIYALRNKGIYYYFIGEKQLAMQYIEEIFVKNPELELVEEYYRKIQAL